MLKKIFIFILVLTFTCTSVNSFSREIKEEALAKLIIKIISYDKNFSRFGNPIKIGTTSNKLAITFSKIKPLKIKNINCTVKKVTTTNFKGVNILIVDSKDFSDEMKKYAEENKILVFGDKVEDIKKGASFTFFLNEGKPKIAASLDNIKAQGSKYPANFLNICRIYQN